MVRIRPNTKRATRQELLARGAELLQQLDDDLALLPAATNVETKEILGRTMLILKKLISYQIREIES